MDCKQAEIAMMQHMEKTITPQDAKDLAQHILSCASCREYYLAFDEMMENATDEDFVLESPPADFTKSVMAKVGALAEKTETVSEKSVKSEGILMKAIWGISAVFMGAALYFILNPEMLPSFAITTPVVDGFLQVMAAVGNAFAQGFNQMTQLNVSIDDSLSVIALFFAIILGGLLTLLYNEENHSRHGVGIKA